MAKSTSNRGQKSAPPPRRRKPVARAGGESIRRQGRSARARTGAAGAQDAPGTFRARVRMYRHGLGDCFLVTLTRRAGEPFEILIDCGALQRTSAEMTRLAEQIEAATRRASGKARLDLVIATHEHKDHLSGFNQAREVFDRIEIGGVWMGWTEDPADADAKRLARDRSKAFASVGAALASPRGRAAVAAGQLNGVANLHAFSAGDDTAIPERKTIADALNYLRFRGEATRNLRYLEPGAGPLEFAGVEDVRAYILGPPRDRKLLLGSEVTEALKSQGGVYHLSRGDSSAITALNEAMVGTVAVEAEDEGESESVPCQPFSPEHSIARDGHWFGEIQEFVRTTYDDRKQTWRRIDHDWTEAFGDLALKLANDTNNTSLVLAMEFGDTQDVLLFVGDAQVGNWLSWRDVSFEVPGRRGRVAAQDLVRRTVFYKVGHHASHNATLKKDGLELMTSDRLVAFIPLDRATAAAQGRKDPRTKKPKGWDMPAKPLLDALEKKAKQRVVISDRNEAVPQAAVKAGIQANDIFVDYFYF